MNKIEMVDLRKQYSRIKAEIDAGIQDVLNTSSYIRGHQVVDFQHNLEQFLSVKHVIPVGNGTDALQIALMALDLKSGDEVITPAFTFVATVEVISLLGLTPVFVDVDFETFTIDMCALEKAITHKTKAIIPVHLFGQNANMEALLALAAKHQLHVIEDACQSIGARYTFADGRSVMSGCMGEIGCTSFFPSKNLGCYGDGGAIFTNNDVLAKKMRAIANHGMEVRYHHDMIGVNSRLDSIQAAVLDVKLPHLDAYTKARQTAAHYYNEAFAGCSNLITPVVAANTTHVFHQYTLKLVDVDREKVRQYLADNDIPAMIYYPVPLHLQKAYQDARYKAGDFPVAEQLSACVLSLPMHTELDTEQLRYIADHVLVAVKVSKI